MQSQTKKTILIVDDEFSWRELFIELLEEEFDVTDVATYTDALAAIQTQNPPFHVIITDIRLEDEDKGNEDGLLLITEIKRAGELTKAIVVTGYHSPRTEKRAGDDLDAFAYFEKSQLNHIHFCQEVLEAANAAEELR